MPLLAEFCCQVDVGDKITHRGGWDLGTRVQVVDNGQCVLSSFAFKLLLMRTGRLYKSNKNKSKRLGELIHREYMRNEILHALQLGIRHFAGQYMALPTKELSPLDFTSTKSTCIKYSKQDSRRLPPGAITDFEWKDYCPVVFRHLHELENIDSADYMLSVCGHETLREVSSPGKSGSLLYLSKDDRFVIKTLRKNEVKVFLEMLPSYYHHVRKYGASLLTKFYGLHVVRPAGGLKVYFVVMENIFQSDLSIHKRYDLKGSSQGRTASKVGVHEKTTFKDLDLDFCFYMNPSQRHRLLAQIRYDCEFLEAVGIMDYSLLLGVHIEAPCRSGSLSGRGVTTKKTVSLNSLERHKDTELTFSDICEQPNRPDSKFGTKMPARAIRISRTEGSVLSHLRPGRREPYNVLLYFGIIDILQGYNVIKRIEHAYKSLQYDSRSISAVNPKAYSARFQDFIRKIFQADDPDLSSQLVDSL